MSVIYVQRSHVDTPSKEGLTLMTGSLVPSHDNRLIDPFSFSSKALLTINKDILKMNLSSLRQQIHHSASIHTIPSRRQGPLHTYFPLSALGQYVNHSLNDRSRHAASLPVTSRPWIPIHPSFTGAASSMDPSDKLLNDIQGVYYGIYGPHGYELVNVTVHRDVSSPSLLEGLKVVGDPNVPAGELTFRSTGGLEAYRPWTCRCMFHRCDCFTEVELGGNEDPLIRVHGRVPVECRTAGVGFTSPSWNSGYMYIYEGREGHDIAPTGDYFRGIAGRDIMIKSRVPQGRRLGLLVIWDSDVFKISSRLYPLSLPL